MLSFNPSKNQHTNASHTCNYTYTPDQSKTNNEPKPRRADDVNTNGRSCVTLCSFLAFICCTNDTDMKANPAVTKTAASGPYKCGDTGLEYVTCDTRAKEKMNIGGQFCFRQVWHMMAKLNEERPTYRILNQSIVPKLGGNGCQG